MFVWIVLVSEHSRQTLDHFTTSPTFVVLFYFVVCLDFLFCFEFVSWIGLAFATGYHLVAQAGLELLLQELLQPQLPPYPGLRM